VTPGALLRSVLHARRGGSATAWEACTGLLRELREDADVLAVTAPGTRVAVGLADTLDADRLFVHSPPPRHHSLVAEAVVGGARGPAVALSDRDAEVSPTISAWPVRAGLPAYRLRRVDTIYADSHQVGMLVLDRAAAAVLSGARRLLTSRRPALLLDGGEVAPAERPAWLERAVAAAGGNYRWHDSLRLPLPDAAARRDAVLFCAESIFIGLAACIETTFAHPAGLPPELAALVGLGSEDAALAALAWGGWGSAMLAPTHRVPLRFAFGPDLACSNFHVVETDGLDNWWRWSGPGPRSIFVLPLPTRGVFTLRLEVVSWGVVERPEALALFLNGVRLPLRGTEIGAVEYGPFPAAGPGVDGGRVVLELVTPATRLAGEDDPRRIGVCLAAATLLPED
jgi:hypothetical protein